MQALEENRSSATLQRFPDRIVGGEDLEPPSKRRRLSAEVSTSTLVQQDSAEEDREARNRLLQLLGWGSPAPTDTTTKPSEEEWPDEAAPLFTTTLQASESDEEHLTSQTYGEESQKKSMGLAEKLESLQQSSSPIPAQQTTLTSECAGRSATESTSTELNYTDDCPRLESPIVSLPDQLITTGAESDESTSSESSSAFHITVPRRLYPISLYHEQEIWKKSTSFSLTTEVNLIDQLLKKVIGRITPEFELRMTHSSSPASSDEPNFGVFDFTLYPSINASTHDSTVGRMTSPSDILSQKHHSNNICMDYSLIDRRTNVTYRVLGAPINKLSISLDVDTPQFWVRGPTLAAKNKDAWYELMLPSEEYSGIWKDFLWQSSLATYVMQFVEHGPRGRDTNLSDFRNSFVNYHIESKTDLYLPRFLAWHAVFKRQDYRQHVANHFDFIWQIAAQTDIQHAKVFLELSNNSISPKVWSTRDRTVVTPYVYTCFSHIFGNILREVKPVLSTKKKSMSHVLIHERIRSEARTAQWQPHDIKVGDFVYFDGESQNEDDIWRTRTHEQTYSKRRSKGAQMKKFSHVEILLKSKPLQQSDEVSCLDNDASHIITKPSDTEVSCTGERADDAIPTSDPEVNAITPLDNSSIKSPTTKGRDYFYITEVIPDHKDSANAFYRGLWCYQPGTWHTQLDTSYYKHRDIELLLSDHCNCPEKYSDHRFVRFSEVDGKASVNLYRDCTEGKDFFCRTIYLHDEGNFMSLRKEHLDPAARFLLCECMTRSMRENAGNSDIFQIFCEKYSVGDVVLLDPEIIQLSTSYDEQDAPTSQELLQPYIISMLHHDTKSASLRQLVRRESLGYHHCLLNEVVLGPGRLEVRRNDLNSIVRHCGLWHCDHDVEDANLPNQVKLHGSGEIFFVRLKLLSDRTTLAPCTLADLTHVRLENDMMYNIQGKMRGIDMFCGAGNLGEGIRDAGVVQYSDMIDVSRPALHTYQANHVFQETDDPSLESNFYLGSVNRFLETAMGGLPPEKDKKKDISFIVAGSPCQGFSNANILKDSANSLKHCSLVAGFASYLDYYRPDYAVLENVKGLSDNVRLLDGQIINVHRQLLAMAVGLGYQVRTFTNHAWMHGAGQSRDRIFVIFAAPGLTLPQQPIESHQHPARHSKHEKLKGPHGNIFRNPRNDDHEPKSFRARLCRDLWSDLPDIGDGLRLCITHPDHRHSQSISYPEQLICKSYGGFARGETSKVSRSVPGKKTGLGRDRTARTASEMYQAGGVPRALVNAFSVPFNPGSTAYGRCDPDRLAPTIITRPFPRAKYGGTTIHYSQPRRFTIAEAKRAQGFFDTDVLLGSAIDCMKMVGNSVSRHASYAIGLCIRDAMLENQRRAELDVTHTDERAASVLDQGPMVPTTLETVGEMKREHDFIVLV